MRVLILLAILGAALAVPKKINRIVGGSPTTVESYPYMSNMQYGLWGIWWYQACGGSLITSYSVLSAAHCYIGDSPSEWRVRLGSSYASTGGNLHGVFRMILHPEYNHTTIHNDVAIIRLSTPTVFSNIIQPVRIAGANYLVFENTSVITAGWGALSYGGSYPEQLHNVTIKVINQRICAERYAYLKTQPGFQHMPLVTDGMLCAGILDVGGKDACQGDSGGPLVWRRDFGDVLVGIVSWGHQCANATYPGVNARVSRYTSWIINNA